MIINIIDTETTGLDHVKNEVIEIGIVNFDTEENEIICSESILICPRNLDAVDETYKVHGIKRSLIDKYGIYVEEGVRKLKDYVYDSSIFLAHNAEFDKAWFKDYDDIYNKQWVCSQDDIIWPKWSSNKHLISLAIAHDVAVTSAHRALEDCLTLARLLKRVGEENDLDEMLRLAMRPKAIFEAQVSYNDRDLAKNSGFRWIPEQKSWQKRMFLDDVSNFCEFPIVKIKDI